MAAASSSHRSDRLSSEGVPLSRGRLSFGEVTGTPPRNVLPTFSNAPLQSDAGVFKHSVSLTPDHVRDQFLGTQHTRADSVERDGVPLPVLRNSHTRPHYISCDTVRRLLDGEFEAKCPNYIIMDARYPFEYSGGHIKGAVSLPDPLLAGVKQIYKELLRVTAREVQMPYNTAVKEDGTPRAPHEMKKTTHSSDCALIFHCEFSQSRGPRLARAIRSIDREMNDGLHPFLTFEHLFVLKDGYRQFYRECSNARYCEPYGYTPMHDERHKATLIEYENRSRGSITVKELVATWNDDEEEEIDDSMCVTPMPATRQSRAIASTPFTSPSPMLDDDAKGDRSARILSMTPEMSSAAERDREEDRRRSYLMFIDSSPMPTKAAHLAPPPSDSASAAFLLASPPMTMRVAPADADMTPRKSLFCETPTRDSSVQANASDSSAQANVSLPNLERATSLSSSIANLTIAKKVAATPMQWPRSSASFFDSPSDSRERVKRSKGVQARGKTKQQKLARLNPRLNVQGDDSRAQDDWEQGGAEARLATISTSFPTGDLAASHSTSLFGDQLRPPTASVSASHGQGVFHGSTSSSSRSAQHPDLRIEQSLTSAESSAAGTVTFSTISNAPDCEPSSGRGSGPKSERPRRPPVPLFTDHEEDDDEAMSTEE